VPLTEVQTTLQKQKISSLQLPKLCGKTASPQNFTEIGQSAAELWPKKNDF